jgi:hypothetical protein
MVRTYTVGEQLRSVLHPREYPYPATFNGNFLGQIVCGHNPHLYARLVHNFRPVDETHAEWEEVPIPDAVLRMWEHRAHNDAGEMP